MIRSANVRCVIVVVVLAVAVIGGVKAASLTPRSAPIALTPVSEGRYRELLSAPLVADGAESRESGIVLVLVSTDFNTGVIAKLDPTAELLQDKPRPPFGFRSLVVHVEDADINDFLAAVETQGGVKAVSKSWIRVLQNAATRSLP